MKMMVACANGAGTSLMMKMTLQKVVKKLNLDVSNIHHTSLSEAKSSARHYDVVFCPLNFQSMFKDAEEKGTIVIGLKNALSAEEMEEKLKEHGIAK